MTEPDVPFSNTQLIQRVAIATDPGEPDGLICFLIRSSSEGPARNRCRSIVLYGMIGVDDHGELDVPLTHRIHEDDRHRLLSLGGDGNQTWFLSWSNCEMAILHRWRRWAEEE